MSQVSPCRVLMARVRVGSAWRQFQQDNPRDGTKGASSGSAAAKQGKGVYGKQEMKRKTEFLTSYLSP